MTLLLGAFRQRRELLHRHRGVRQGLTLILVTPKLAY